MPDRWDYFDENTYYKIGRFNYVFMWNNKHWQRSSRTEDDLNPTVKPSALSRPKPPPIKEEAKKARVLRAIHDKGGRNKQELQIDTGLNKASLRYALKDLVSVGKLQHRQGVYSVPAQLSIFMGLKL
jgi:hypothetical protein